MPPMVYLSGPPGTGKTVVLLLVAMEWLRCGHHVYIVSVWSESHVACIMLYHLLLQTISTQQTAGVTGVTAGHLHLLQYEFKATGGKDVDKAVNELSQAANGRPLYVIADEMSTDNFVFFFNKLLMQVPRLHFWAASCYHIMIPGAWSSEFLTRPLRCPPVVVREVEKDKKIAQHQFVQPYTQRGIPDHTDGPPVKVLYHRPFQDDHSPTHPADCVTCGREVASFLHSLRVGLPETVTSTTTPTPPCLQWRDVMVVYWREESADPRMVTGLRAGGVAARLMTDDDMEDVATARSDVVWVGEGHRMQGLERKVVVCVDLGDVAARRFRAMSRCTSQLVIVKLDSSHGH
ncbi:uncharacterized protein LOC112575704 [Pomacea canaliculata]|uniref:uncharacterized protein LOC112575704 n=1 Tax=Pomacea canaliculata TaxID=400727 RepID=UPI000D72FA6C|nr:uncharacterized protein LOC112575704 [Pomacea canaliculata]XP_025113469.1 uncharacterized protein LOC112575704 [Pomacea canaliculata]XP_025113470.1 uncharacterized protein LOC112575704 [Pomacea canaliculata]XP_025113471.1 uncharacterized protein LOC112575704 [Pomacea canaliculata]XP_025113472.1 uncharacterized protein LOC112575704 [Pomacea canaliculata]XP_025113474.1 uncharacterized protein LOC112575704 [Pomacea canaliculata]XP_025113475.1 uncharacterized protein LOC112575704 [Pomacea cana